MSKAKESGLSISGPARPSRCGITGRQSTYAGGQVSQVAGRFAWITPHGRVYVTDGRGTHRAAIAPYESVVERRLAKVTYATPARATSL